MKALIASMICMMFFDAAPTAARDIRQEEVRFNRGEYSTTIKDQIKGYQAVDYRLLAKAGQSLDVTFKPGNLSAYFNILPPGSNDVAMFVGSTSGYHFERVLPGDGVYTIRVYLMRSAARRNESSDFTLTISVRGKALTPLPSSVDATLPGTPYHASARIPCVPFMAAKGQECEVFIIRRGFDGTATVEVRSAAGAKRLILFVEGKPVASDSQGAMTSTRQSDLTTVNFANEERYEIPDALIAGD